MLHSTDAVQQTSRRWCLTLIISILMGQFDLIMLAAADMPGGSGPAPHHPCRNGLRPAKTGRHIRRQRQHYRHKHELRSNDGKILGAECIKFPTRRFPASQGSAPAPPPGPIARHPSAPGSTPSSIKCCVRPPLSDEHSRSPRIEPRTPFFGMNPSRPCPI